MPFDVLPSLDRESVLRLAHRYAHELAALDDSADRVVDKMPDNTTYLGMIVTTFPRAQLIHCRRDLRDVALSCWLTDFWQVRWACVPDEIARRIAEHERLMEHWRRVLPVPMLEVDYEDLVADLETGARAIVAFCGLEWDPACLEFHKTRRPCEHRASSRSGSRFTPARLAGGRTTSSPSRRCLRLWDASGDRRWRRTSLLGPAENQDTRCFDGLSFARRGVNFHGDDRAPQSVGRRRWNLGHFHSVSLQFRDEIGA